MQGYRKTSIINNNFITGTAPEIVAILKLCLFYSITNSKYHIYLPSFKFPNVVPNKISNIFDISETFNDSVEFPR